MAQSSNLTQTSNETVFQSALDALTAHIAILDGDGTILLVNQAWKDYADENGYRGDDYGIGNRYLGETDPHDPPQHGELATIRGLREVMIGLRPDFRIEYPCHSPGRKRWFVMRVNRYRWQGMDRIIVAHDDITELKLIRKELIEQERLTASLQKEREVHETKNRFLSMMSHEMRTPLASIRLSSDMLAHYSDRMDAAERAQYLNNVNQQIELLQSLVSDVLTLSQAESPAFEIQPVTTDLITFVRDVIEQFDLVHHRTRRFSFECEDRAIQTCIDQKLMYRVISNLLTNAIKYSGEGGQIALRLWREGDRACLAISDDGIGIPQEFLPTLFEPFQRASNVGETQGSGLGLAIVRQIMGLHGGRISATSQQGQGSTFTLELPINA
jgi:PAS domain S-box-containing protein